MVDASHPRAVHWITEVLNMLSPLYIGISIGVVLLLILWYFLRKKRRTTPQG